MPVRPTTNSNSAPTSASATGTRNSPAREYPPETYESAVEELEPEPLPLPSSSRIAGAEHFRRGSAPAFGPRKDLPSPPVGPVMPDFHDMVDHRRRVSAANADDAGVATVKRKTSVVKKFKDRVVKA
ncbi:uncharacterized protein EHS24_008915 [Apiotrichum porosum]|uniref:Uncharacterized protein n=1 Tax=Apiotrichum porosum TaxID=105984 RepID=A0A427XN34_9TREE|nr:uncharacterized protein EHS24_008915 [Apiotrichum porosum]RSH80339.1 hypothetical protein EHS24_008915 [Apiotrichum porosum]